MTLKSNNHTVLTVLIIAFAAFIVAIADSDMQLLKNTKPKNPNHKGGNGNCNSCGD